MVGRSMNKTVFLNKASAASSAGATPVGPLTLPPELLADASRRLGWAGLVYGTTYLVAYFGPRLLGTFEAGNPQVAVVQNWTAVLSVGLGYWIFVLSRLASFPPQRLLDLGLVFGVVGSFGISVAEFAQGFSYPIVYGKFLGVPWECVWIMLYPLVAPNTPGKILTASLASASSPPITLFLSYTYFDAPIHHEVTRAGLVTYFLFTSYICAVLAFVMARVIIRYTVKLTRSREIGAYELIETLGEGGMGEVWVARHRLLARPAAVKLIRPELMGHDPHSREALSRRFEREARATAQLGSTHTVDIYDFGRSQDGAFFYVMELLDGMSLDALIRQHGPINAERVVYLLKQVCHSLGEAHERGLIHRDIKPANIFVCRLGPDYDFVKVLDFGLVKSHTAHVSETELTATGTAAGTPAYMAPEMATGTGPVDGRADLYALGCVAYWMLTGTQVFEGESSIATILKHVRDAPVPPSRRTEIYVPPELEGIILSCLEKDPDQRPSSADELMHRLSTVRFARLWTTDRARQWWDAHSPKASSTPQTTS
jgi:serine/threonine-protein kinase